MIDAVKELEKAVKLFWSSRGGGNDSTDLQKYAGARANVVGGQNANGFIAMLAAIVVDAELDGAKVHFQERAAQKVPGYYRPCKMWDLVVVYETHLVAAIEVKSHVGSFGNNYNNRVEEAVGNAADFWAAYAKGLFKPSQKPWLGYLLLLEDHDESTRQQREIKLQPFQVDLAFQRRSYAKRYELSCERLVRERMYDAACLIMSRRDTGLQGQFTQPNPELGIVPFSRSLYAHVASFAKVK